jgi:RNA polymerase sigma factor (sigma-70 family)
MAKERIITQEQFDELLDWLDPDRDKAGIEYETIRQSLIRIFIWRGFGEADELADETIDRATLNILKVKPTYVGDPAPYFYSVANNLALERGRQKKLRVPLEEVSNKLGGADAPATAEQEDDFEAEFECLSLCMQQLEPDKRELILAYYQEEKQAKINRRKQLALREQLDLNALRVRVHRIRIRLEKCIENCLRQTSRRHKGTP